MANKSQLQELRDLARKRHRAATAKVSRLRTRNGADVSGTRFDPRRDPSNLKRYTAPQLRAYIRQLDKFVDRSTQFYGSAEGGLLTASKWREYKKLERKFAAQQQARFAPVANIKSPFGDETIRERMDRLFSDQRHIANASVNTRYKPPVRDHSDIANDKALSELIRQKRKEVHEGFNEKQVRKARKEFKEMLKVLNKPELLKAANQLSDRQFDVVWTYLGLADDISLPYEIAKKMMQGKDEPWHASVFDDNLKEAGKLLEWGKNIKLGG